MAMTETSNDTRSELHDLIAQLRSTNNAEKAKELSAQISALVDKGLDSGELSLNGKGTHAA